MNAIVSMSLEQRRQLVDTRQLWDGWDAARERLIQHQGSMAWRTAGGHEYLARLDGPAHRRRTRSLGRRSPDTERVCREFIEGKQQAREAVQRMGERLAGMARINRALRLARVPLAAAKIMRVLHRRGVLGRNVVIVGTNAVYAYEAAAGVFVASEMLATGDLDILLDARRKLRLRGNEEPPGLLDMLRDADWSARGGSGR